MASARAFACLGMIALAVAGCGGKEAPKRSTTGAASALPWPYAVPLVEYGRIRSLTPLGRGYELRFDLHLLFGPDKTGLSACVDNHECPPGVTAFLDDTYDHDLKFVVTYYVRPATPVDLVSASGRSPYPRVTARYFYGLVHGQNPRHVRVMASGADALRTFAFYIEVGRSNASTHGYETVARFSQVYHP